MKTLILISAVAVLWAGSAHAQLFTPESVGGALLGGVVGGVVGHNQDRHTAEGAAIGAGAGLLLGQLLHNHRHETGYYQGRSYRGDWIGYESHPSPRPNHAITGTVLGGIAGGVIGHNHHRQTAEGIAIGAGAGLLLGSVAEQHARQHERFAGISYAPTYKRAAVPSYVVRRERVYITEPVTEPASRRPKKQSAQAAWRPFETSNKNYRNASNRGMAPANRLFGR